MDKTVIEFKTKDFRNKTDLLYELLAEELIEEDGDIPDSNSKAAMRLVRWAIDYACDFEEDRLHDSARLERIEETLKGIKTETADVNAVNIKLDHIEAKLDKLLSRIKEQ